MLRPRPQACCPPPEHPVRPAIRAGLSSLPRQATGFPHYRRAMLQAIRNHSALSGWHADSDHDLGVQLIEAWAYVLDITSFYDALIAGRSYLGTAADDTIAAEIVALTGYRPRPAMVARVRLALEARGRDAAVVPAGTGFRSQPFGDEKAQVFELAEAATIWPQRNRWPLAPHGFATFDGVLRFAPNEGPNLHAVVSIMVGSTHHIARVTASDVRSETDGRRYRVVATEPALPAAFTGLALSGIKVTQLALTVSPSPLDGTSAMSSTSAILDALYPMVQSGSPAAVEVNGQLRGTILSSVGIHSHAQSVGSGGATATIPLTQLGFASIGTLPASAAIRIHLVPKPAGRLLRPAETRVSLDMIRADGRLAEPGITLNGAPAAADAIALGQGARGIFAPGVLQEGRMPRFVPHASASGIAPLETPIAILGNVVTAIRGETVSNEVLGSGNAQTARQRFKLRKKPLSWIEDPAADSGRRPQLLLRVDGVEWRYVESLYGRGPEERIFALEVAPDGTTAVVGGDGERGARFPSGVNNILATYRYGAGAAKPPPGSISQVAKPAPSLSRVSQPLDAWGGADAETAAEMRDLAPAGALTLGRAVSLADFEAMIRSYSGIINAAVNYSWDQGRQDAVVTGWIVADSGDPSETLAAYLAARALPGLPIRIALATKVALPVFDINVVAAQDRAPEAVRADVRAALFDPAHGFLSPRNVPVGAPLFRSRLLEAIHAVPGVASVPSITLAAGPMPKVLVPGEGRWFDFLSAGQVL